MAGAPINKSMAEVERELSSAYGFVPQLFRAQSVHTLVVAAEARLLGAVLLSEGRLTRQQKEGLLCAVASVRGNEYCRALHPQALSSEDEQSRALHDFALQLTCCGLWFSAKDIDGLTRAGFDDQAILEAVSTIALGQMLCAMAAALEPSSDFERPRPVALKVERPSPPNEWEPSAGPYLKSQPQAPLDFEPFSFLRDQIGFIPKLFRAQISHPRPHRCAGPFSGADCSFGGTAQPDSEGRNTVSRFRIEPEHLRCGIATTDTRWTRCVARRVGRNRKRSRFIVHLRQLIRCCSPKCASSTVTRAQPTRSSSGQASLKAMDSPNRKL